MTVIRAERDGAIRDNSVQQFLVGPVFVVEIGVGPTRAHDPGRVRVRSDAFPNHLQVRFQPRKPAQLAHVFLELRADRVNVRILKTREHHPAVELNHGGCGTDKQGGI